MFKTVSGNNRGQANGLRCSVTQIMRRWREGGDGELMEWLVAQGLVEEHCGGVRLNDDGRELLRILGHLEARPCFNPKTRTLSWHGVVVKELRREALCQETLLMAFEESGWPERIDDPLEQTPGIDPKERLREAVKSLNLRLEPGSIRFHADGNGGVRWQKTIC